MDRNPNKSFTAPAQFFNGATQLSKYLGVDPVTIRRLIRRKALPYTRLGGRYLFRRSEIEDFIERHSVPAVGCGKGTARKERSHA